MSSPDRSIKNNFQTDCVEVSIVMPCLNEKDAVGLCVSQAVNTLKANSLKGEVIVSDNGSCDNSQELAQSAGARLVLEKIKGYGRAYKTGIAEARGKYIIIADSDGTYDFSNIVKFIEPLRQGYAFVNGSRLKGKIHKGAMPFLHRYLGNPFLSFALNLFFKSGFTDVYCGMKAFTKEAYEKIKPISPGMEFALELIINATRFDLRRTEVPIELFPRKGKSKLRPFKDAWRSLRFMLLFSPNYLFIFPGGLLFLSGFLGMAVLLKGPVSLWNHTFDFHAMIFSSILILLGFQLLNLGFFAKSYALAEGFERRNTFFTNFYKAFNLEKGIFLGILLIVFGVFVVFSILKEWIFLGAVARERQELFALTIIIIGVQVIFSSFLISLIGMKYKEL